MTKNVTHPVYGMITYEENIWSGKKTVSVNGCVLRTMAKNTFVFQEGETPVLATLKGSALTGVSLTVQGENICILSKPAWYDWVLAVLPFVLNIIWGNSAQLCSIVPVVGGAIGGALNGVAVVLIMSQLREKSIVGKLLTALVGTVIAFAVCTVLALLMISAVA